jgi:flagellar biosynthesis protein FlhF
MQVKKFEAPTLQEALDTIKRELGPEAIILQTKQNRRGFGLMSKSSVEVTAAVSARAIDKKKEALKRVPEAYAQKLENASANKQADFYENYLNSKIEKEKVQIANAEASKKRISAVRYADIQDDGQHHSPAVNTAASRIDTLSSEPAIPQYEVPSPVSSAIENYSTLREANLQSIQDELANLKRLVEELRKERKRPEYIDSDSPFSATEALSEAYDLILQSGIERRFAVQIMREIARNLSVEARAESEAVLDAVADQLMKRTDVRPYFGRPLQSGEQAIRAFIGVSGSGKTACLAKLATHSVRTRNEKIGIIRIRLNEDEGQDPLVIFAKALHVPYRLVSSVDELNVAIQDMAQANRIFIDTPGLSPRDVAGQRTLRNILQSATKIHVDLVVSATTRDLELHEQGKAFSALNPDTLFFTRLDETYSFGSIYSLSQRLRLPVSVFTTGKKVTEEWENASAERLTAAILNIL